MNRLQQFVELLTGSFDNREQYEQMQKEGNQTFPAGAPRQYRLQR